MDRKKQGSPLGKFVLEHGLRYEPRTTLMKDRRTLLRNRPSVARPVAKLIMKEYEKHMQSTSEG
jgi:hypothetical protein